MERLEVDLAKRAVWYLLVDEETAVFLVVGGKVLDACGDACSLYNVDIGASELAAQKGIFGIGFEIATAARVSRDTD